MPDERGVDRLEQVAQRDRRVRRHPPRRLVRPLRRRRATSGVPASGRGSSTTSADADGRPAARSHGSSVDTPSASTTSIRDGSSIAAASAPGRSPAMTATCSARASAAPVPPSPCAGTALAPPPAAACPPPIRRSRATAGARPTSRRRPAVPPRPPPSPASDRPAPARHGPRPAPPGIPASRSSRIAAIASSGRSPTSGGSRSISVRNSYSRNSRTTASRSYSPTRPRVQVELDVAGAHEPHQLARLHHLVAVLGERRAQLLGRRPRRGARTGCRACPTSATSFDAVFSPTPGMPGMLSVESPLSAL